MTALYNSLADARRAYARGRRYLVNHLPRGAEPPAHIKEKLGSLMHHSRPPSPKSVRLEMARDRRKAKAEKVLLAMTRVLAAKKELDK